MSRFIDAWRGYTYVRRACGHDEQYRLDHGYFHVRLSAPDRCQLGQTKCELCRLKDEVSRLQSEGDSLRAALGLPPSDIPLNDWMWRTARGW